MHIAWHWIRTMYEVITSTHIDQSKWREKRRNVTEVQRSGGPDMARTNEWNMTTLNPMPFTFIAGEGTSLILT